MNGLNNLMIHIVNNVEILFYHKQVFHYLKHITINTENIFVTENILVRYVNKFCRIDIYCI